MILALDVGNTNIKIGLYLDKKLLASWRVASDRNKTADEYGLILSNLFQHSGFTREGVRGIIISSVIPSMNFTMEHMCKYYFGLKPLMVSPGIKTGLNIRTEDPKEVGADRIVNSVSAYRQYGGPCIVIDFGTATTFGFVTAKAEFMGGCICPGVKISTDALVESAAMLPKFELAFPDQTIGKNTITNMQAGVLFGCVGQVEYIVRRMKAECGANDVKVVATGGMARLIASATNCIDHVDPLLTLEGLRQIYELNQA